MSRFDLSRTLPWVEVVAAAVAVMVSAPLWGGCFATGGYLFPVALAPVAGAAVVLLVRGAWWRPLLAGLIVSVGYLLGAVEWSTFSDWHPTAATWTALRDGVFGGWLRLLTAAVPIDVTPTLLITPVLVTFWAGWIAVFLCHRGRRAAAPLLPGLAAFVLGLLFGATLLRPSLPLATAWLACAAVLILLRGNRFADGGVHISRQAALAVGLDLAVAQRRSLFGRLAFGVPTALLVVAAGGFGAKLLPIADGAHRFDLRTEIAPPVSVQQTLTPLATLQSQLTAPADVALFTVAGLPAGVDRVRIAALDDFDGANWTADPSEQYLAAGHRLALASVSGTGSAVSVRVTLSGLTGPFLPDLGTPSAVDISGLGYNPVSDTLVAPADRPDGLSYTLTTVVARADPPASAAVVGPTSGPSDTELPPAPPRLVDLAHQIAAGATSSRAIVINLQNYLQRLPYSVDVRPGHSYGAIARMLEPDAAHPADANGFAEQHASAFVVLARLLGIPARVAVGYLVDPKAAASGSVTVSEHDAHAWAEIPVAGYGWVPVETVNRSKAATAPQKDSVPTNTPRVQNLPIDPGNGPASAGAGAGAGGAVSVLARSLRIGGLVVGVLVVLPLLLVLAEKQRRRWVRRRRRSPAARVVGAWLEAQDRLVEHGLRLSGSGTTSEIADQARTRWGRSADAAGELATLVTRAVYAADEPDAAQVGRAWACERRLRRDLARSRPWWNRLLGWIDPRPLVSWHWPRLALRRWRWA